MITESIIKTKFIVDGLKKGVDIFCSRSLGQFREHLKSKTGNTYQSLSSPNYTIVASGDRFQVVGNITKQLRFQDMGVRKIYTKPFHAAFYGARNRMQYGLHNDIKETIRKQLETAVKP